MRKSGVLSVSFLTVFLLLGPQAGQASLSSQLGATKLDGLSKFADCQNEATGYREGLIADRLELKLANSPAVPPQERGIWLAEINALRAAQQTRKPFSPPDPSDPQRHLRGLNSKEDQAINSMNIRFHQEVKLKCEQQHGGMARYSEHVNPANQLRYENQLRERMNQQQVILVETIPVEPLPSLKKKSPEEIQQEKETEREAFKQAAAQKAQECMAQSKGLRLRIVAQTLQNKLDAASGLSAAEKKAFQEDVQAAWASAGKGLDMIEPADPKHLYRAEQRLTQQDQMAINTEFIQKNSQVVRDCMSARMPQS